LDDGRRITRRRADQGQIRHLERDVVDARAVGAEEAMQEAVRARGLQDLDDPAGRERPRRPSEHPGRPAPIRHTAQDVDQGGGSVGDARQGDGDMIELSQGHRRPPHLTRKPSAPCIARAGSPI
jgi:hypothetical protein